MSVLRLLGLIGLLAGTAVASSLTIDSPVVSGILTGSAGDFILIQATITATTPLVLGQFEITDSSVNCSVVCVDTSVYFDPANNFFAAQDPTTTPLSPGSVTTGWLMTIAFQPVSQATSVEIGYTLFNADQSPLFSGFFEVIDQPSSSAPEPGTFAMIGLALSLAVVYQRRSASRGR